MLVENSLGRAVRKPRYSMSDSLDDFGWHMFCTIKTILINMSFLCSH